MKTLVYLYLLNTLLNCRVSQDFEMATIEEQTTFAGGIVLGKVNKVLTKNNNVSIILKNTTFYKGCHDGELVEISNFNEDSECGVGIPKLGDEIIAFICDDTKNKGKF